MHYYEGGVIKISPRTWVRRRRVLRPALPVRPSPRVHPSASWAPRQLTGSPGVASQAECSI